MQQKPVSEFSLKDATNGIELRLYRKKTYTGGDGDAGALAEPDQAVSGHSLALRQGIWKCTGPENIRPRACILSDFLLGTAPAGFGFRAETGDFAFGNEIGVNNSCPFR